MKAQHALLICLIGCSREPGPPDQSPRPAPVVAPKSIDTPAASPGEDPALAHEQMEYVDDVIAFTQAKLSETLTREQVRARMKKGSQPLRDEWNRWEAEGKMTPERITAFYKQTTNYIYELAEWHFWVPGKRESDLALVADLVKRAPKNVIDFGGGTGIMAILLARAGLDVTIADLDGTTLAFAQFRARRHGVELKVWKSDVEPAPPDAHYDIILALDVLEHLPHDELTAVVDKLIDLKHARTQLIMSAPFGRTSVHPMHMDADEHTRQQIERLRTELPR